MKVVSAKAPVKSRLAKSAIISVMAASIMASPVNSLVAEAHEPENTVQMSQTESRYQVPSFEEMEMIDTKLCVPEEEVEQITEKICREGDFQYVTPEILESIAFQESRFRDDVINGTSVGAYQIKPECHPEELAAAGLSEGDLYDNFENQTRFAAEVVEKYAQTHADKGLSREDTMKAAVANYHLCQQTADKMISTKNWDEYVTAVMCRKDNILEQKALENHMELASADFNEIELDV